MRVLKRRLLYSLAGGVVCACAAVLFACTLSWHAAVIFAVGAAALVFCFLRYSESYKTARLICENPILNVGMASVAEAGSEEAEETCVTAVVSGFGILMDGKPYKFGHGGVDLTSVEIDRESISLSFAGNEKSYSVRLLHGVADKAEVDSLCDRLRYETGVDAKVCRW